MPILLIIGLWASTSFATVTAGKIDCPVQFEGRAEEVFDGGEIVEAFSKVNVVFKTSHVIKGEVEDKISVKVLKHGPVEIEVGEDYRVQLRDGKVCWIERL